MIVGWFAALAAEPVPIFQCPFEGERPLTNFFDHGSTVEGQVLSFTGELAFGKTGHVGYDFALPEGTPLRAMADGVVLAAGDQGLVRCPGGKSAPSSVLLRILHEQPDGTAYVTMLLHLQDVAVVVGDPVVAGQLIGHSGNTGCSSGPHLHFAVTRVTGTDHRGYAVDPFGWSGTGPDPRDDLGYSSGWMWRPDAAPALRRTTRRPFVPGGPELLPIRMCGTDALDPVGGEWIDLALDPASPGPVSLAGWSLRNGAGEAFALPSAVLSPGDQLRVWSRHDGPTPGNVSLARASQVWRDAGDCASLIDPTGRVTASLLFGRKDAEHDPETQGDCVAQPAMMPIPGEGVR